MQPLETLIREDHPSPVVDLLRAWARAEFPYRWELAPILADVLEDDTSSLDVFAAELPRWLTELRSGKMPIDWEFNANNHAFYQFAFLGYQSSKMFHNLNVDFDDALMQMRSNRPYKFRNFILIIKTLSATMQFFAEQWDGDYEFYSIYFDGKTGPCLCDAVAWDSTLGTL